jgi:hypothetical protein
MMKMNFKNHIINKPAFYLSENMYFHYIIALSRILSFAKLSYALRWRALESTTAPKNPIFEISGLDTNIRIQSKYRVSRFLKGFAHAGERQWIRYGIPQLLGDERPDALIDVGANVGEVSYFGYVSGISRIIAIDPDPTVFECLAFNLVNSFMISSFKIAFRINR